jgi:glycolate oxidase iron-sulfur subunit
MQTNFTAEQLAGSRRRRVGEDPAHLRALRFLHGDLSDLHLTLGDELDSPRGRIYLIKDMLENGRPADEKIVKHIDRCLSCLACMTTCPSGVHYMHLVDHARAHIEKTYRRPLLRPADAQRAGFRAALSKNVFAFASSAQASAGPLPGLALGDPAG